LAAEESNEQHLARIKSLNLLDRFLEVLASIKPQAYFSSRSNLNKHFSVTKMAKIKKMETYRRDDDVLSPLTFEMKQSNKHTTLVSKSN